ncbi:MAG: hypothetical protein FJ202_06295 [Gemmatimonadetes bacterium]|nr:hypothetical protein [Gemmatimonadota bacterium]
MIQRLVACTALAFVATDLAAQGAAPHQQPLGTISFPNSGNAAAQAPFIRGMLLYYSFEYEPAATAFQEAQKADPLFALAYAGEALTYTHQVWNQQNLATARGALARLAPTAAERRAKARTPREQMYLDAVEALYGEGSKPRRDTLFTLAAERASLAHPKDHEAKMWHALGLLGLNQSVREFTSYMQAGALAEEVLRENPDHPAAAHFVIHAFDDPVHAPLGLWAARAYSRIAPGSPHALHMTSHIFVALGMWDDVIARNTTAAHNQSHIIQAGHYSSWLGYGYTQAGRYAESRALLDTVRANFGKQQRGGEPGYIVNMRASYVIDGERWTDPVASWQLNIPLGQQVPLATDAFVAGMVALKRGDKAALEKADLAVATAHMRASGTTKDALNVVSLTLRAATAAVDKDWAVAASRARDAALVEAGMPFEFGPPQFVKPPEELHGEILLAAGRAAEAQAAFTRALARTPGRTRALIGLARAARAAGDAQSALTAAQRVQANWHKADAGLPEAAEMRAIVESKGAR